MAKAALEVQFDGKKSVAPAVVGGAFAKKSTHIIDQSDILLPKILLMQGLSKLVAEELAKMGDMVNSVTNGVIGGKEAALEFVPISTSKKVVRYVRVGDKLEYEGTRSYTHADANLQWEEEIEGKKYRNDVCLDFYVLLKKELDDPRAMPYCLSFRRTSYTTGKKLATHFAQCEMAGLEPFSGTLKLSSVKRQNDQGTFYIFDVTPAGNTDEKHAPVLVKWSEFIAKSGFKVDESDLTDGAEKSAPVVGAPGEAREF